MRVLLALLVCSAAFSATADQVSVQQSPIIGLGPVITGDEKLAPVLDGENPRPFLYGVLPVQIDSSMSAWQVDKKQEEGDAEFPPVYEDEEEGELIDSEDEGEMGLLQDTKKMIGSLVGDEDDDEVEGEEGAVTEEDDTLEEGAVTEEDDTPLLGRNWKKMYLMRKYGEKWAEKSADKKATVGKWSADKKATVGKWKPHWKPHGKGKHGKHPHHKGKHGKHGGKHGGKHPWNPHHGGKHGGKHPWNPHHGGKHGGKHPWNPHHGGKHWKPRHHGGRHHHRHPHPRPRPTRHPRTRHPRRPTRHPRPPHPTWHPHPTHHKRPTRHPRTTMHPKPTRRPKPTPKDICHGYECPAYTLENEKTYKKDGYQKRCYKDISWAYTVADRKDKKVLKKEFLRLHKYIQGANSENKTIKMTVPVVTKMVYNKKNHKTASSLSFYIPLKGKDTAPVPNNKKIGVKKIAKTCLYVRQFQGFVMGRNRAYYKQLYYLSKALRRNKQPYAAGISLLAVYNSPWERPRWNEVMRIVSEKHEDVVTDEQFESAWTNYFDTHKE